MGFFGWGRRDQREQDGGGVDGEAMLAELRQIRSTIERLTERLGETATRTDLKAYTPLDLFNHHLESHRNGVENWRAWLPWAVSIVFALFELLSGHAAKLLGGG